MCLQIQNSSVSIEGRTGRVNRLSLNGAETTRPKLSRNSHSISDIMGLGEQHEAEASKSGFSTTS